MQDLARKSYALVHQGFGLTDPVDNYINNVVVVSVVVVMLLLLLLLLLLLFSFFFLLHKSPNLAHSKPMIFLPLSFCFHMILNLYFVISS